MNATHLSPEEAAARLHTSPKTLANWRNKRIGPPFLKFGQRVLYPIDKLEAWEAKQMVETA